MSTSGEHRHVGDSAGVRVPPPLVYVAGFVGGLVLQKVLGLPSPEGVWIDGAGAALIAVGAVLAGWSVLLFRRARTHLDPSRPTSALVTGGPYRVTRNPIYLGFSLVYLGLALLVGSTGSAALLVVVLIVIDRAVIRREEQYLERVLHTDYRRYRAVVRRWL